MKAIILAAGRGSRLGELTDEHPKCLVEVRGRTLLDWQLAALHEAGITEIGLVTGYRRECLTGRGLIEFNNPHWAETQMVSSLACAAAWLEAETCILSYADIFYETSAVRALLATDAPLALTYDPHWLELWRKRFDDPLKDAETFRLNGDGTLAEIGQRPHAVEEIEGQYMGLLRCMPAAWAELRRQREQLPLAERDQLQMTDALQRMIIAGRLAVMAVPYTGDWGEVDGPEDLRIYNDNAVAEPVLIDDSQKA